MHNWERKNNPDRIHRGGDNYIPPTQNPANWNFFREKNVRFHFNPWDKYVVFLQLLYKLEQHVLLCLTHIQRLVGHWYVCSCIPCSSLSLPKHFHQLQLKSSKVPNEGSFHLSISTHFLATSNPCNFHLRTGPRWVSLILSPFNKLDLLNSLLVHRI